MPTVKRAARGLARAFLGGTLFLGGLGAAQAAPPSVAKMLEYAPRQEVRCTTPTAAEQAGCKVELVKGSGGGSGWMLKDAGGRALRRFYSSNGRSVDSWSYYKDGVEVYREVDTTGTGKPDQYRWLNGGGSKWGVDKDKDGRIDTWKVISPEEVSQEALRALATKDLGRLRALMVTDDDLATLGVPAEQAEAIREKRKGVKAKFEATVEKLTKLTEKAVWLHLETGAPECLPADQAGTKADLIQHRRGTVLFESGGSNEWFQVGAMLLVNQAWKVIDAPAAGAAVEEKGDGRRAMDIGQDPKLQKLVEELTGLDKKPVGAGAEAVKHHLARADVLEKIVAAVKASDRDPWIRQVADSLSSAVQAGTAKDTAAAARLGSLEKQLRQYMEGSPLTAYVVFRRMQANYSQKLSAADEKSFDKVQKDWVEQLTGFVKAYPTAEDTPDAMLQLGMVSEFLSKEVEAKNWYGKLAKDFAGKPQGAKAAGAARRLDLEGKAMTLSGPTLADPGATADISELRGKVVIVYYWASWNGQAASDFAKLKAVVSANAKDVALVTVNLDATAEEAKSFVSKQGAVGTHLHQKGGLDSKLATDYGVMVLPSTFVVGKDGKCVNRAAQVGALEDEVKKQLKK